MTTLIYPFSLEGEGAPQGRMRGGSLPVSQEILTFARQLRKSQTNAENLLWHIIRDRRFCGFKFRRQVPFHGYILDFYCHQAALAIELDGGGHNDDEQRLYDEERSRIIESAGVRVVRFWNNDVLKNTEVVLEKLYVVLHASPPSSGLRPPSPSMEKD